MKSPRRPPRVELICVGTELLTGKASTHAVGLADRLSSLGLSLVRETVVGDDPREMAAAFREVWRRAGVVICAGGLGPTFDDITRDVWSRVTGRRLVFVPTLFRRIAAMFRSRGMPMAPENRRQAYLLKGAEALENPNGTAPGQRLSAGGKVLILLPGPGGELFPMVDARVLPWLRARVPARAREARAWRTFGVPESAVDEKLRPLAASETSGNGVEVVWGILAQDGVVDVKAAVSGVHGAGVRARADALDARVRKTFGPIIYGTGKDTLEEVVGRSLLKRRETVSTAESCTGGLVAARLTRVPGSSAYFQEARVTYADRAKTSLLGVPRKILRKYGAVSAECAEAMAAGCRRRAGTDWALALTGIAGPAGGTIKKPVGLVYISLAGPTGVRSWEHRFDGDRARIRERAALWALNRLRTALNP